MGVFTKSTSAADEALRLSTQIEKIQAARAQTAKDLSTAQAAVETALAALAGRAAEAALGEGTGNVEAARKALETTQGRVVELQAMAEGLVAKEASVLDELMPLASAIEAEIYTRATVVMEKHLASVRKLAGQLRSALLKVVASASVAGPSMLSLQEARLQIECGGPNLIEISPSRVVRAGSIVLEFPFQQDPEARKVSEDLAAEVEPWRRAAAILERTRQQHEQRSARVGAAEAATNR